MIRYTLSINAVAIIVATVGVAGYLAGAWNGLPVLFAFLAAGCLIVLIWMVGAFAEGIRRETRR